jgi:hypothetical protein
MRALCLLASCSLFAAAPGALGAMPDNGGPAGQRQSTGDAWDIGAATLKAPCQRILSEMAFPVPPALRERAVGALQAASVVPLGEGQAAALLDRPSSNRLFADLLLEEVTKIQGQKKSSVDDQLVAHDLIQAMAPHYPPYRPYLIRALAGSTNSAATFTLKLCDDTLLVDNASDGDKASRSPMIVFLQARATTAIPSWYSASKGGR